jgi:ribosomal protein L12E/L44/L45/RPP1/RPP2
VATIPEVPVAAAAAAAAAGTNGSVEPPATMHDSARQAGEEATSEDDYEMPAILRKRRMVQ